MGLNYDQILQQSQAVISGKDVTGSLASSHGKLLNLVMSCKRQGANATRARSAQMRKADETYRAYRQPDADDKKAAAKGEPQKIYYPLSYAQIQTDVAGMMAYYDQEPFFKLDSRGPGFYNNAKLMELEIQYQLDRIGWPILFYQWLLNSRKYGYAKMNCGYDREFAVMRENKVFSVFGLFDIDMSKEVQTITYEGNFLENEDPYRLCFDNSVSFANFQKGRFIINQEEISYEKLKASAKDKGWVNLDGLPKSDFSSDIGVRTQAMMEDRTVRPSNSVLSNKDTVILDHCFIKIVPAEYGLWPSDEYQMVQITVANEVKVIRAIPALFRHGKFPASGIEYSPDTHEILNDGLSQTVDNLQDLCNWFLNSHVSAVSRMITNQVLVDPNGMVIEDLEKKRPYIRMTPTGVARGADRILRQIQYNDTTTGHVNDALASFQFMQRATGINDNFMGMQLPTARTATEVNNFTRLGEVRFRMAARLAFCMGLRPLAEQMISNTQHFMSVERFLRVTDKLAQELGVEFADVQGKLVRVQPADLAGQFDISVPDLGSGFSNYTKAQDMKDILVAMMQNPQMAQVSGIDINKLLAQYFWLIGMKNAYEITKPMQVQVLPDQQIAAQAQAGNLVPTAPPAGVMGQPSNGPTPDMLQQLVAAAQGAQ